MLTAVDVARLGCAALFLTGMTTGVWKYRAMITSTEAQAPAYVDICHRAALMYAFACLILAEFAGRSAWPEPVNITAVAIPIFFFMSAVAIYGVHGVLQDTDNQLRRDPSQTGRNVGDVPVHEAPAGERARARQLLVESAFLLSAIVLLAVMAPSAPFRPATGPCGSPIGRGRC